MPEVRQLLQAAFKHKRKVRPVEITERFPRIGLRAFLLNVRPMVRKGGEPPLILLAVSDITARKDAEQEKASLARQLAKERAFFEAVLRQMKMGAAIFEAPSGKLLLANDALQSVLKRKVPASADMAFFHKIHARHVTDGVYVGPDWPMERSLRKGEIIPYEEIILERAGAEWTVLQISSSPVYDERKQMIAVVALFLDITERKRIKEQVVDISSREQQRIAHDLHDGLGQELAAIGYRVKALKSRLTKARAVEADEAGKIGMLAEAALARIRDLVKFLQPVAMDAQGLMQSLKDLARSSSQLYHVDCSFVCPHTVPITSQDVAIHVYRIAQEAVHNAVKHGKPRRIVITLRKRQKLAELTVANNGLDFNATRSARKRGLGLHIMSYRANVLHGVLAIKKKYPKGTVVKCLFMPNAII